MTPIVPSGLTPAVFRALYPEFDLIVLDDAMYAIPRNSTNPMIKGSTLTEVAWKISDAAGQAHR